MTEFEEMAFMTLGDSKKLAEERTKRYKAIFKDAFDYAKGNIRIVPDPDDKLSVAIFKACEKDLKEPVNFLIRQEDRESRLKKIFKVCYELLAKYIDGVPDTAWTSAEVYYYWKGKLNEVDVLAVEMFAACVEELHRQYKGDES